VEYFNEDRVLAKWLQAACSSNGDDDNLNTTNNYSFIDPKKTRHFISIAKAL
jgi:hypothetical protein